MKVRHDRVVFAMPPVSAVPHTLQLFTQLHNVGMFLAVILIVLLVLPTQQQDVSYFYILANDCTFLVINPSSIPFS